MNEKDMPNCTTEPAIAETAVQMANALLKEFAK